VGGGGGGAHSTADKWVGGTNSDEGTDALVLYGVDIQSTAINFRHYKMIADFETFEVIQYKKVLKYYTALYFYKDPLKHCIIIIIFNLLFVECPI
jgi:hypothetical protein